MVQTALQQLLSTHRVWRATALQAASAPSSWSLGELCGRLVELSGQAALTVATGLVLQAQRAGEPTAWIARAATFFPPDVAESGVDLAALAVVLPAQGTAAEPAAAVGLGIGIGLGVGVGVRAGAGAARSPAACSSAARSPAARSPAACSPAVRSPAARSSAARSLAARFPAARPPGLTLVRQLRAAEQLLRSGAFGLVVLDLGPVIDLSLPAQTRLASLAQKHDSALLCLTEKDESAPSLGSLVSLHVAVRRRQLPDGQFRCEVRALKDKRRGPGWVAAEVYRGPAGLR